jgi:hypothetical protein
MPELVFALMVGFILGLIVGFLMRSENRKVEVDFGGREDAEH